MGSRGVPQESTENAIFLMNCNMKKCFWQTVFIRLAVFNLIIFIQQDPSAEN